MANEESVYKDKSKSDFYISGIRKSFHSLEPSLKHFMQHLKLRGKSILDVGCAAGGLYEALTEKFKNIKYTGVDVDERCIEHAKKTYPDANFYTMNFMDNEFKDRAFDVVMMWNWTHMAPEWKKLFREACRITRQFILFDTRLRLEGTTVIDLETSFQYYHHSLRRNYYIVHNIYELLAFFHVEYLVLKRVSVYAYRLPGKTSAILPLSSSKVLVGTFCLEKYTPQEASRAKRYGTRCDATSHEWIELDINVPGYEK